MRLFTSTLRKLVRRPASLVTVGLLLGLLVLIILATATVRPVEPEDEEGAKPDPSLLGERFGLVDRKSVV